MIYFMERRCGTLIYKRDGGDRMGIFHAGGSKNKFICNRGRKKSDIRDAMWEHRSNDLTYRIAHIATYGTP